MGITNNLLLISSVLLVALALADAYGNPTGIMSSPTTKKTDVVVEGIVYCQHCKCSGTWNLEDSEPIPGAIVSVICRNYRRRISYYKAFITNDDGYFYAQLTDFSMRHPLLDHPLQSCTVKLVSSPLDTCDVFTNINYGIKGSALRYENKKTMTDNYQAVVYAAGPLAFRPDYCPPTEE